MKVQMVKFGGIANNRYLLPGQIVDVSEELAQAMLGDGRAIPPRSPRTVAVEMGAIETTEGVPPMNAARRVGRPRKG